MKKWFIQIIVFLFSLVSYFLISFQIERSQFLLLFFIYSLLFIGFFFLYIQNLSSKQYLFIGLLLRAALILAIPSLSDDFYRFIWDGKLAAVGINPYLIMPEDFINSDRVSGIGMLSVLFEKMNSPDHYTIYPPANLVFFIIGTLIFPSSVFGNILVLRAFIVLADVGVVFLGKKILNHLKLNSKLIWLYFLNPFIVLEFTGSLHFEGIMIFFILWAIWLVIKNKWILASIVFAVAASVKVVPLMLLPLFFHRLGFKRFIAFGILTMVFFCAFFIPLINPEMFDKSKESYLLYFQVFEINASFYYIIRAIGFWLVGYNIIQVAGPVLAGITFIIILLISFHKKNKDWIGFFESAMFIFSIYYFFAAIVHPWYIAVPLVFSLFTRYRYALAWSFLIVLSYYIYRTDPPKENMWLIFVEYLVVYGLLILEYAGLDLRRILDFRKKPGS